jgi:hypothetical protein
MTPALVLVLIGCEPLECRGEPVRAPFRNDDPRLRVRCQRGNAARVSGDERQPASDRLHEKGRGPLAGLSRVDRRERSRMAILHQPREVRSFELPVEANRGRGELFEPITLRPGARELELHVDAFRMEAPYGFDQRSVILQRDQRRSDDHAKRRGGRLPLGRAEELFVHPAVLDGDATPRDPNALNLRGDWRADRDDVRRKPMVWRTRGESRPWTVRSAGILSVRTAPVAIASR